MIPFGFFLQLSVQQKDTKSSKRSSLVFYFQLKRFISQTISILQVISKITENDRHFKQR
ncbi:hypothetical protein LEP1GSC163_1332 [Leptospira santarosai str. CBC379]|uniref:Uncharacterized protein n=1 Tax=Leptospira santarosai serovar Arenal str. MAVJ 401 TaxID=1049976 RepID=M6JH68_9LEPT|nr:hypothetical protein LEP1GSC163_1332 [Leptospira santarosai str. CBC379]EMM87486.1 hypothetical protein LEP1GSC039_0900 [Leptospira santarosai str. 2000027870]EMN21001.1 hypothetical protein LEP1GSC063_0200 [Leptospira santarosai serovar Arenal str. MAVJ 401]